MPPRESKFRLVARGPRRRKWGWRKGGLRSSKKWWPLFRDRAAHFSVQTKDCLHRHILQLSEMRLRVQSHGDRSSGSRGQALAPAHFPFSAGPAPNAPFSWLEGWAVTTFHDLLTIKMLLLKPIWQSQVWCELNRGINVASWWLYFCPFFRHCYRETDTSNHWKTDCWGEPALEFSEKETTTTPST